MFFQPTLINVQPLRKVIRIWGKLACLAVVLRGLAQSSLSVQSRSKHQILTGSCSPAFSAGRHHMWTSSCNSILKKPHGFPSGPRLPQKWQEGTSGAVLWGVSLNGIVTKSRAQQSYVKQANTCMLLAKSSKEEQNKPMFQLPLSVGS